MASSKPGSERLYHWARHKLLNIYSLSFRFLPLDFLEIRFSINLT